MTTYIQKTEKEVIDIVLENSEDLQSAVYALEDGEALLFMGFTDADQEAIEGAHDILRERLDSTA